MLVVPDAASCKTVSGGSKQVAHDARGDAQPRITHSPVAVRYGCAPVARAPEGMQRASVVVVDGDDGEWPARLQNWTMAVSVAVQLVVLVVSAWSIGLNQSTELLTVILWIELIVQIVEFVFYLFFLVVWIRGTGAPLVSRYFDWAITTPIMLCSLFLATVYLSDRCRRSADVAEEFSWLFLVVILFDWIMLLAGAVVESEGRFGVGVLDVTCGLNKPFSLWTRIDRQVWMGLIGFASMVLGCFLPILIVFYMHHETGEGAILVWLTLFVWSLYGVVALVWTKEPVPDSSVGDAYQKIRAKNVRRDQLKNAAYNVLDLFSKNAMGVLLTVLAFESSGGDGLCSPPSAPPLPVNASL
jgi:hypothetical protein